MKRVILGLVLAGVAVGLAAETMQASGGFFFWRPRPRHFWFPEREKSFQRVGTLANYKNTTAIGDVTVSEIVAASADGRTLVYTDSEGGTIGFIDITNPSNPTPTGTVALDPDPDDDLDYSPTSVAVLDNQYALAAVNTSESLTGTSGVLAVVDITSRAIVAEVPLGGQPDSVKISPDRRYAAIAIENERSEDICVGGTENGNEVDEDECAAGGGVLGGLPQTPFGNPPGFLAVVRLAGPPSSWTSATVDLTGLSTYAPEDPEPEFVDINGRNEAVVTLQENNHIAIVDLPTLKVVDHFEAGTVTLDGVDATEDGIISLSETLVDVPREPDAVTWVPGLFGRDAIATANEGDLFGGSRGFSIFRRNGGVWFDSGTSFEEIAVKHGHYPEARSANAGTEPEAIAYGRYGRDDFIFVASERGGFVAVYELDLLARPRFVQLLPAPLEPEGLLVIPQRNLVVASGEADVPSFGVRSTVMIYELKPGRPSYPQILSEDDNGTPIPWSALSGLVSVPGDRDSLLAVWDGYYAESRVLRLDVSDRPAVITDSLKIQGGTGNYDPEGIAIAPDDSIWIASEGVADDSIANRLLKIDGNGQVIAEVGLPEEIIACRAATTRRGTLGSGFEGLAVVRQPGNRYHLVVAQQRGWDYTTPECEDLDDDAGGLNAVGEPNRTRLWVYDPLTGEWDHGAWELAPKPANASWVGLSEITEVPGTSDYIVIERDNRTGDFGVLKTLVKFNASSAADRLVSQADKAVFNLRPQLTATNGWITDKPEGVAVTFDGRTYVATDNDGVEDWSGETWFLGLGRYWRLFN